MKKSTNIGTMSVSVNGQVVSRSQKTMKDGGINVIGTHSAKGMKVYLVRKNGRYLDSMFAATGMDTAPTLQRCAIFIGRESAKVVAERCGGEVVDVVRKADDTLEVLS